MALITDFNGEKVAMKETIADIVKDIKERAEAAHEAALNDPSDSVSFEVISGILLDYAKRIEKLNGQQADYAELETHLQDILDAVSTAVHETEIKLDNIEGKEIPKELYNRYGEEFSRWYDLRNMLSGMVAKRDGLIGKPEEIKND